MLLIGMHETAIERHFVDQIARSFSLLELFYMLDISMRLGLRGWLCPDPKVASCVELQQSNRTPQPKIYTQKLMTCP